MSEIKDYQTMSCGAMTWVKEEHMKDCKICTLQAKVDRLENEKEYLKTGGCYLVCAASIDGGTGCGFCLNCKDEQGGAG